MSEQERPTTCPARAPRPRQHGRELILDARNIAVNFKVEGGIVEAVRDVSFQLHKGETIALVGESGSGKSVTARTVMGLLGTAPPSARAPIMFNGEDIVKILREAEARDAGQKISMIFQEPMSSLNPVYTVGRRSARSSPAQQDEPQGGDGAGTRNCSKRCKFPSRRRGWSYPHQLSGGQRQRVMIAMALANRPDMLIADEPTTALDVTVQAQILQLIKELKARYGMAVILITHDLTIVRAFSQYVYVMRTAR